MRGDPFIDHGSCLADKQCALVGRKFNGLKARGAEFFQRSGIADAVEDLRFGLGLRAEPRVKDDLQIARQCLPQLFAQTLFGVVVTADVEGESILRDLGDAVNISGRVRKQHSVERSAGECLSRLVRTH